MNERVTVETIIESPIEKIWECWTDPRHIQVWCHASDDWYAPRATNDLRVGGMFSTRMEARDGSEGFDFSGRYDVVVPYETLAYTMEDGRKVEVVFAKEGSGYKVIETFDPEQEHSIELQRAGWQAILGNFKVYVLSL